MKSRDLQKPGGQEELSWWESGFRDRSSLVYALAGKGAIKKLLSQKEKERKKAIALMRTFLTNQWGDEWSPKKRVNSFSPCAHGLDKTAAPSNYHC